LTRALRGEKKGRKGEELTLALKRRHVWQAWVTALSRFVGRSLAMELNTDPETERVPTEPSPDLSRFAGAG